MGIETIRIEDNGIFKAQTIKPHPNLNIIVGKNGSGKTTFLRNLVEKYSGKYTIRSLLASVQHFKSFIEIERYENTASIKPTISRQFLEEYTTITRLIDDAKFAKECNEFFDSLAIPTKLHISSTEAGWLLFRNPRHKSKKAISLERISPGERTAFVLWLLIKNAKNYDILVLDEFDAHLSFMSSVTIGGEELSVHTLMYKYIVQHFVNNNVQVFISTNRTVPDLSRYGKSPVFEYKKFVIRNGIFEEII